MNETELFETHRNIEHPLVDKTELPSTYYNEIRLSRAFARAVDECVPEHYMAPEVKKAWNELIEFYNYQMREGVQ